MKNTEAGYSLMETLLTIAIILTVSCILVITVAVSIKTLPRSANAIYMATTIARIDRHIRSKVGSLHIPYWADPKPYIDLLTAELYQSKIGRYITSITLIRNTKFMSLGLEVTFNINNHEQKTNALFASKPVLEKNR